MKYLDETGLDKLIEIIKSKITELSTRITNTNNNAYIALTTARTAEAVATDAKNLADEAKTAIGAMAALTEAEVENVWNGAANDPTTPGEGNS